jgi:hypothetical protein
VANKVLCVACNINFLCILDSQVFQQVADKAMLLILGKCRGSLFGGYSDFLKYLLIISGSLILYVIVIFFNSKEVK